MKNSELPSRNLVIAWGILAGLAFGHPITPGSFPVAGIEDLDVEDLRQAKRMGYAIKLLGSARSDAAPLGMRNSRVRFCQAQRRRCARQRSGRTRQAFVSAFKIHFT